MFILFFVLSRSTRNGWPRSPLAVDGGPASRRPEQLGDPASSAPRRASPERRVVPRGTCQPRAPAGYPIWNVTNR
jgi:hypothetical protein